MSKPGVFAAALAVQFFCGAASAADWGALSGAFKYDGAPPKPAPIAVDKDKEFCGKHMLVDESLVVDPKTKAIQNVVVLLYREPKEMPPPIHPDLLAAAKTAVKISNENCRFAPRIIAAMTDQPVILGNGDPLGHNMKVDSIETPPINVIVPAMSDIDHVFEKSERGVTPVSCSIHPWMRGYFVVRNHPYVAITGADGKFELKNLPAGKWTFHIWQEKTGHVVSVKVKGKETTWTKGRVTLKIEPNKTTELGDVLVSPANFEKK